MLTGVQQQPASAHRADRFADHRCMPAGHQLLSVWLQNVPVVLEPAHGDCQSRVAAGPLPKLQVRL